MYSVVDYKFVHSDDAADGDDDVDEKPVRVFYD